MDESDHQFERQYCPVENASIALQSLDTVRALHQTVVSLRTALEDAHKEIDDLKKQILIHDDITEGHEYRKKLESENIKEKYSETYKSPPAPPSRQPHQVPPTLIPPPRQPQEHQLQQQSYVQKSEHNYQQSTIELKENNNKEKITEISINNDNNDTWNPIESINVSNRAKVHGHLDKLVKRSPRKIDRKSKNKYRPECISANTEITAKTPSVKITSNPLPEQHQHNIHSHKHHQMSKIDVKIKVSSNVKVDDPTSSSNVESTIDTTSDSQSGNEQETTIKDSSDPKILDDNQTTSTATDMNKTDNIKLIVTSDDKIDNNINNKNMATKSSVTKSSNDIVNLDDVNIDALPELDKSRKSIVREIDDTNSSSIPGDTSDVVDGAINNQTRVAGCYTIRNINDKTQQRDSTCENQEEVDDIELIFSSDDKELLQEDLISISDYEPWQKQGSSGTPILVDFGTIPSDDPDDRRNSRNTIVPRTQQSNLMHQHHSLDSGGDTYNRRNESDFIAITKSHSIEKEHANNITDENYDSFYSKRNPSSAMGRKWTNCNVLIETDISKCGITDENILEMGRRNTCPNPPSYRPIVHREALLATVSNSIVHPKHSSIRCPLAVKFSRAQSYKNARSIRPILHETQQQPYAHESHQLQQQQSRSNEPKRSSSAQTDISALPEYWRSENNLVGNRYGDGLYTLPSKFAPPTYGTNCRYPLRVSDKTQEARRILLSDINFTSMVPELSRSADHLCHEEDQNRNNYNEMTTYKYYKENNLKTPDYQRKKGITPSISLTSPGVSQWTVYDNSLGTQTTQTENFWGDRGDSFDSCRSYSLSSRYSNTLGKHHRSRSVPSIQCAICKQNHVVNLKTSESMNYTPRVTFQDSPKQSVCGSLPDLRHECNCGRRFGNRGRSSLRIYGDSSGSTESLLDEAEDFLRKSMDVVLLHDEDSLGKNTVNRRCSENDIKRDFSPSRQSLPYLPKSSKCLKLGHLAKVIAKNGRLLTGRVRYIGPLVSTEFSEDEVFIGLQLPTKIGDCDGSIDGRRFFDCQPLHGVFVPFNKIVMAWSY